MGVNKIRSTWIVAARVEVTNGIPCLKLPKQRRLEENQPSIHMFSEFHHFLEFPKQIPPFQTSPYVQVNTKLVEKIFMGKGFVYFTN